ncbi:MAG: imidazole glycerol-phosphate synthase subunit HisF, partial [Campylobacterota bacterium]|nr:imidazole glycerol-phosphate synthase subunit HisF [Campylobacterota bacterium]
DDVRTVLNAGADKVSINSEAIKRPSFIKEIASVFGSQCVVCSIDIKKVDGLYRVFSKKYGLLDVDPLDLAKEYEAQGAGEILLTSVDHEGTTKGYDLELLKLFKDKLSIPIIINGGMGQPEHGVEALQNGADALAAGYIFHFTQYTPDMIKEALSKQGFAARI